MFAKEVDLQRTLKMVMPRSTAVVDYKENGDGDAVLLCHDSLRIVERGVSGKGFAAWVKVHTRVGIVGVLSLHAPNDSRSRKKLGTLCGKDRHGRRKTLCDEVLGTALHSTSVAWEPF
ncbi:hypothetical protein R1sor_025778 [Riccia sorocarpa]|uniref:Uncharacterized protein n=1 Tax=Riccia sorocarpa TaxID=122646 RepID=A0ABD3GCL4_9MARC